MTVAERYQPVVRLGGGGGRFELGGVEAVFKSPTEDAPDAWMALDYTLPAGRMGAPLHYHRHTTESFYVISGELSMQVGEREVKAGPGSYVFVPPGVAHSFANRSDGP